MGTILLVLLVVIGVVLVVDCILGLCVWSVILVVVEVCCVVVCCGMVTCQRSAVVVVFLELVLLVAERVVLIDVELYIVALLVEHFLEVSTHANMVGHSCPQSWCTACLWAVLVCKRRHSIDDYP